LNFSYMMRVAALSTCCAGAAHANGNFNYNPPAPDPSETSAGSTKSAGETASTTPGTQSTGQLVRASWYGGGERLAARTSTGEVFRPMGHTAAHRTLPFGTLLKVTAASSGRTTIVRINDRGPAASSGRALDLSRGAALDLGIVGSGQAPVYIEVMR
jgi:rare lipoprotein A